MTMADEQTTSPRQTTEDDPLLLREQLRERLCELGYPLSQGTMNQLCAPSRNEGPPIDGYWGRRPLHRLSKAVVWARSRLQQKPHRIHPDYGKRRQASADA
jgi:hypothetical protein